MLGNGEKGASLKSTSLRIEFEDIYGLKHGDRSLEMKKFKFRGFNQAKWVYSGFPSVLAIALK